MEVAYFESDPKSAPHAIAAPERNPPSDPPFLFVPDPNDKYPVSDSQGLGTGPDLTPPQQLGNGPPPIPTRKKKWPWFLAAALTAVAIIVAGVVGGVVGSRSAQSNESNDSAAMSSTPTSATSTISPSSTSSSRTESASSTSTSPVTTVEMYSEDPCSGTQHVWSLQPGSSGCRVVDGNKRSILIRSNQGCNVTTWSSPNCEDQHYEVPDSSCHSVLFAGVSYSC